MKKILLFAGIFLFLFSFCYAGDVSVKGYYRKDGTYVRPHHRSSPDGDVSNNYGRASSQQRQQYQSLPTLPSYNNDYDNDGVANRYDRDDDNDGISDSYDSGQYSRQNSNYRSTYTQPTYQNNQPSYSGQTQTVYSGGKAYQATPQSDGSYVAKDFYGNSYRIEGNE